MINFNWRKSLSTYMLVNLLICCLYCVDSFSQNTYKQADRWINHIFNDVDKYSDEEVINTEIERLSELINKQILINFTDREELSKISFLTDKQIESLLFYIHVYGPMYTLDELQLVEGFDYETIQLVKPFFKISTPNNRDSLDVETMVKNLRYNLVMRSDIGFPLKKGYVDKDGYRGLPLYNSIRFKAENYKRISFGLVMERDAGERGMDYYSAFVRLQNRGVLNNLIIGNYKVKYGAGLLINNGFSMGKNYIGANLLTRSGGFTPHSSVDEYNYLQGIAAEFKFKRWRLYPFWSYRRVDADICNDTIRSIIKNGLHRTKSQKSRINTAYIISYGARSSYRASIYEIGISTAVHHFSKPYFPNKTNTNINHFRGDINAGFAIDYQLRSGGFYFSGETSFCNNIRLATVNALTYYPSDNVNINMLYRYYDKDYFSWMSRSYSEGSIVNDEQGFSLYIDSKWLSNFNSQLGIDFFSFEWLKTGVKKPSWGYELSYKQTYQHYQQLRLDLSYRLKIREKNNTLYTPDDIAIASYQRHSYSLSYTYEIAEQWYLRGQIEGCFYRFYDHPSASGFLLSQRLAYRPPELPFVIDIGVAIFQTDNSLAKVYLSEKNLLYAFGYPSFYGRGMRTNIVAQYEINDNSRISTKWGQTYYFDREEIGTGLETIKGNIKNDISIQLNFSF